MAADGFVALGPPRRRASSSSTCAPGCRHQAGRARPAGSADGLLVAVRGRRRRRRVRPAGRGRRGDHDADRDRGVGRALLPGLRIPCGVVLQLVELGRRPAGDRRGVRSVSFASPTRRHDPAGLILLAADGSIAPPTRPAPRASRLVSDDAPQQLPEPVAGVVRRAHRTADGEAPARANVRTRSGTWVVVRGSRSPVSARLASRSRSQPMRAHDLAPVAADAYGLTERERELTQLVAQGLTGRPPPPPPRHPRFLVTWLAASRAGGAWPRSAPPRRGG